jgi:hypothetical protein
MARSTGYLAFLLVCTACVSAGGASTPVAEPTPQDRCVLISGSSLGDTIVVALAESPNPSHAPVPRSAAERLAFRHLYETLIRVDCAGVVSSGLADAWHASDGGLTWTFRIRTGATFWDGTPVTAEAVRQSWLVNESERVAPWADSVAGSVAVIGERELVVRLGRPHTDVPPVFADPTLAVALDDDGQTGWPMGTGAYQVVVSAEGVVDAAPLGAVEGDDLPVLRFAVTRGDPRDLIDAGADLLVSSDPLVVQYAASMDDLEVLPLPWDLVYVAVAPLRTNHPAAVDTLHLSDVVVGAAQVDARSPESPPWWDDLGICRLQSSVSAPIDPGSVAGRVVYQSGDAVGRALTERLVALASVRALPELTDMPERLVATRVGNGVLASALAAGRELAYVLPLSREVLDPCAMIAGLRSRMPWAAPVDLRWVLVPLVETRSQAIVRHGIGTVRIDWDGTPYVAAVQGR